MGPRDGLQNEKIVISTDDKLTYIKKLLETGLKAVEITSFVSPKAIPQMGDSSELYKKVKELKVLNIDMPCLVPNLKGFENALKLGVEEIALFTATSSEFTKRNINATVDESFQKMEEINCLAKKHKMKVRGYISTAFGCPYKGHMDAKSLVEVVKRFKSFDLDELSIGDTIGVATPSQVDQYLKEVVNIYDRNRLAMHFHDTRGMALANILVSLEHQISIFDASSGGLGGCPYAKGATGNVATEDLIYLFNSLGISHGVDFEKLVEASQFILGITKKVTPSKYLSAYLKSRE